MTKTDLIKILEDEVEKAVRAQSRPLIYRVFGGLNMALMLGAVSYDDVRDINDYLIRAEESGVTI